jgi:hypothetical protein
MNVFGILFSLLLVALSSARPQYGRSPDYYDDGPIVLCPNYPYCDDAPYSLPHLQVKTSAGICSVDE